MLVGYISSLSLLIPFVTGLAFYRKTDGLQRVFFFYIVFSVLVECYTSYLAMRNIPNFNVFKIFLVCELVFFAWFFHQFTRSPWWYWLISILSIGLIAVFEVYFNLINEMNNINYSLIVFFIFFVFQSMHIILRTFDTNAVEFNENYIFWIAFARLFYFLIILFVFIYPNFAMHPSSKSIFVMAQVTTSAIGNILMNLMYAISFACKKHRNY